MDEVTGNTRFRMGLIFIKKTDIRKPCEKRLVENTGII
jgi:MOSC domain-containing protein YiiM